MQTFILEVQARGAQHEARLYQVEAAGGSIASNSFAVDVGEMVRRFRDLSGEAPLAIGQELYDLVAPTLAPYMTERAARRPARLMLNIQPVDLRGLPWELLSNNQIALFNDPQFPISRLQSTGQEGPGQAREHDWPLRILIVVASEKLDPTVAAEEEVGQIIDAIVLHEAEIDWKLLTRPKRAALLTEIKEFNPHIFHFIGHGGVSHDVPVLKLYDTDREQDDNWDVVALRNELVGKVDNLCLAFINACRTAEVAASSLRTLTDAFLESGATAVIGTQAEIAGQAAARAAGAFYRELFIDLTIDVAMARARQAIGDFGLRDWATPSLELRLPPADLFSCCKTLHADKAGIRNHFWEVRKYVGRQEVFRQAWQARLAIKKRPAVIKGQPEVGKSATAQMLLERCLLAGHRARYVDMRMRGEDYVDLLCATLEGDSNALFPQPHTEPFPPAVVDAFKQQVSTRLGVDRMGRVPPNVKLLFDDFRKTVEEAYPDTPILLIYDHLDQVETTFLKEAIVQFARWYRDQSRVNTLLIIDETTEKKLRDKQFRIDEPNFNVLQLPLFKLDRFEDLAYEYARRLVMARQVRDTYWRIDDYDDYKQRAYKLIQGMQATAALENDWLPDELKMIEDFMVRRRLLQEV